MKRLLLAAALLLALPSLAFAQSYACTQGRCDAIGVLPLPVTSSSVSSTTSATPNTFTIALPASATRRDCTIYSAAAFSIALGASPTTATAIPIAAGGTFKCGSVAGTVVMDQVNIASATASAAYVVWSQG